MDAKNMTVYKVEGTELHRHFKGQMEAQPCYVELDCDRGILYATYNSEIGSAVPMSVYHGHAQRWGIACLNGPAANALLDSLRPLAERVIAGYERVWNGNNYVAKFTDDAAEAINKIEALCSDAGGDADDLVMVWNAEDWFEGTIHRYDEDGKPCIYARAVKVEIDGVGTITGKTTDEDLRAMEEAYDISMEYGVTAFAILEYMDELLEMERDNARNNASELEAEQIEADRA